MGKHHWAFYDLKVGDMVMMDPSIPVRALAGELGERNKHRGFKYMNDGLLLSILAGKVGCVERVMVGRLSTNGKRILYVQVRYQYNNDNWKYDYRGFFKATELLKVVPQPYCAVE